MSLTSRTNRWASRLVVVLQLATWSAVSIVLLQKGVSSLQGRIPETPGDVTEAIPSMPSQIEFHRSMNFESTVSSDMRRIGKEYHFSLMPAKGQIIEKQRSAPFRLVSSEMSRQPTRPEDADGKKEYRISNRSHFPPAPVTADQNRARKFVLEVTKYRLNKKTENYRGTLNVQTESNLNEIGKRIDDTESVSNKIVRSKELDFDHLSRRNFPLSEENDRLRKDTPPSTSEASSREKEARDTAENDYDFVENASRLTARRKKDKIVDTPWRSKNNREDNSISHVSVGGSAAAVTMVTIGAIMLVLGPAVIILRALDERRQFRNFLKFSSTARDDSPPTYEQAILMNEAPRYSTLSLNDCRRVVEHTVQSVRPHS